MSIKTLKRDNIIRMYANAKEWLEASKLLGKSGGYFPHAPVVLSVLGFEILLKTVAAVWDIEIRRAGHDYWAIWNKLPEVVRLRILRIATDRVQLNYAELQSILLDFQRNFMKFRYSYEDYSDMTKQEEWELGEKWLEDGALMADAHFRFHQEPMVGLVHALQLEIEGYLSEHV